ncbi:zinc finger protein 652-B-like isoform X2 [Athalia rosae]|uniref:zinc finger protein 652-B-like isoform X2 n=1 Tax=Athalia rosae TaxID=37344 RepID=UPI0020332A8C|nr:zinc finger protein 652-B-like isoform X2 [Athalia rosae]
MEVETFEADSKDLAEILKQAASGGKIIYESNIGDDDDEAEVEIVEIIEEIEVVEEHPNEDREEQETNNEHFGKNASDSSEEPESSKTRKSKETKEIVVKTEKSTRQVSSDTDSKIFQSRSDYIVSQLKNHFKNDGGKDKSKQVVSYDIDEDWEDEDVEHASQQRAHSSSNSLAFKSTANSHSERDERHITQNGKKKLPLKNYGSTSHPSKSHTQSQITQQQTNSNAEDYWEEEPGTILGYADESSCPQDDENTDSQHEIVKNAENNLIYTVLGSKKPSTTKQNQENRFSSACYNKIDQMEANSSEATIYYENEDMETLYVGQTAGNDPYQYNDVAMGDQESTRDSNAIDAEMDDREEESQEQIFLHEDEDGQLYFKDDTGKLQPVYLTADGNYAIADNSSDDQDSGDQTQQAGNLKQADGGAMIIPDTNYVSHASSKTAVVPASTIQEIDNEDNTVTISLIISEDENGQKRTQVIIPTTDNLKCDTCNKSFKSSFQLLRHNRLKHAREDDVTSRNYPCDLCPKRYADQNALARHRKTHTNEKPFQCLECHKTFPSSTALRRHLTQHNPQSRRLPCIYCGRRFPDKTVLAKHEQSHLAGERKTHTCDMCHKSFMHASDLALHKKNHDPERKFDCEQQGNTEEALSCDVCGITYKFMSSLTRHMVTTHVNPEKMRQQAEEQRRKRENNYRRYMENRKMYECQPATVYSNKRSASFHHSNDDDDDV